MLMSAGCASAQVTVDLDAGQKGPQVSPMLYGIFYEDINHAADGGIYAELVRNRSFEDNLKTPEHWNAKGNATLKLINKNLLNKAQGQALEVTFTGDGDGFNNEGFWGIPAVQGRTYRLSFWAKGKLKGNLKAFIGCGCGKKEFAVAEFEGKSFGKNWTKYEATLTSQVNNPKALLWFSATGKGVLDFDMVSLFPPTFNNRENGMRPDLTSMLYDLHPKFFRFPGGCFVEGQNSPDNAFRWERTIGPVEERVGHHNVNWGYRTSDGLGFHEYLQLAEDLGAKPLYVVNVGIWHGGFTPVDQIQPWIDETLNALEYANGPVTSKYGALRAKNGHPEPFNIEYLEIGNENNQPNPREQSDNYYQRYKLFKDAVLAKYPNMHLIGNVAAWGTDNPTWDSKEQVELVDEHYYRTPGWFAEKFRHYDGYDRKGPAVYVGEYAVTQGFGKVGSLNAALGEAVFMMGMENNSDIVKMASYAPIFANINETRWRPDMIQFNANRAFGTPSYYVQKVMAENVGTRIMKTTQHNPYEGNKEEVKVKPATCMVGMGTWGTNVSFRNQRLNLPAAAPTTNVAQINVKGNWTEDGDVVKQTSNEEGTVRLNPSKFTADEYTYKVSARKDAGYEGFLVVFNYVDEDNYCWLNLGGWGNSQHAIEQVIDGSKAQIAMAPGKVEEGRWYDVELHVKGDSIYASLDGKQIFASKLKPSTFAGFFSNATFDEATGEYIVKLVNTASEPTTARINIKGHQSSKARVIRLTGEKGTSENTIDDRTNVVPVEQQLSPDVNGVDVEIPANSLNIVRVK
ncbi:MAG: carbohydrate binding domain-containing protein [Prevotella sp.]|nr:carbohydrate binding domain-containing protein [Prevotella sp.]